ncbi:MAG TPA: rod shape-determining protein [Gallionellaceae bacterium]|nr:rod shape-determining protein [Gallionellaceae bacterium]
MSFMLGTVVYIAVSPERVTVRDVGSGKAFSEVPEIALSGIDKITVVAIGAEARKHASDPAVKVINPFTHPRSLFSDFTLAEQFLKLAMRRVVAGSIFQPSPKVIAHLPGDPEGGYTQIERRVIREMAFSAGARQVDVIEGREPTDQELLNWTFGSDQSLTGIQKHQ